MEESFVQYRLDPDDRNQVEFKLGYDFDAERKERVSYLVEMFLFIPRDLGFDEKSYSKDRFYADIDALLRFKSPRVGLAELASGDTEWIPGPDSPLDSAPAKTKFKHAKRLACVFRAACQEQIHSFRGKIDGLDPSDTAQVSGLDSCAAALVSDLLRSSEAMRALGSRLVKDDEWGMRQEDWGAVDEYLSLLAEDLCTTIAEHMDAAVKNRPEVGGALAASRKELILHAASEYEYRGSRGFVTQVHEGKANEHIPYHWSVLKRTVEGVLYLDVRSNVGRAKLVRDLTGIVAASVAMLFAVYAAIWASTKFGTASWPFIAVSVVSYAIKDRLKEWGRSFLGKKFTYLVPDRYSHMKLDGRRIGWAKETMRAVAPDLVDPIAFALRHARHPNKVAEHGRPEIVVHYTKEISVRSGTLETIESSGFNDIIRLNTSRFKERMAAPVEVYHKPNPETGALERYECAKVYHLNMVLRLESKGGDSGSRSSQEELIRIVMDQNGVKRVSVLDTTGSELIH